MNHQDCALPGAYLKNCIAPYVATAATIAAPTTTAERYRKGMKGKGWQTITQIADRIASTDNAVRAYLTKNLLPRGKVATKQGIPSRHGPCPSLWQWVDDA